MRRFTWIITLPITILVVLFAVMNRESVTLNLWPLPWDIAAPLYLLTLGCVLFGFLFGLLVMWLSHRSTRRRSRDLSRRVDAQANELNALRRNVPAGVPTGTALATSNNDSLSQRLVPPAI
ncbi:LapA family protein [Dongia soli]|uniref:LapA family protein n=1 Tax=Dongia soli TaxID=600628 RepID=A0ABU5E7B7_9PROT|nr:LapA family protein [Dongia soli]MDY0881751.1 LapA family protein [Dongia soli]